MRRRLFVAALLSSTFLSSPATAMPQVAGFLLGAVGVQATALVGTFASGLLGAGFAAGATFGASAIGGFFVRTVVGLGLSALASALAPQPNIPPPAAQMANYAQPISYAEWVFGRVRKGGPLGFTGFHDSRRYYLPIIAAHSTAGPVEHWLDETVVFLDEEITDQAQSNIMDPAKSAGFGRINFFTGQPEQTADAGLQAAFPEITPAHDFAGLSGAVLWAKRPPASQFSEIYSRGREWAYTPVWDGHDQILDPRDGQRKYTNNAALVMAFWITEVLGQAVDWGDVAVEADVCDQMVLNAEGQLQARWTINGTVRDDQPFEDQRAQMAGACDAFLFERADGKVGFRVGRWIAPQITLGAGDFLSLEIKDSGFGFSAPTEVAGTYIEPENAWRETPSGVWIEAPDEQPRRDEPQLYMVNSHNQCTRLNKRFARTARPAHALRGTIGMIGYEMIGQRFFRVVHPEMNIDAFFEVGELAREAPGVFSLMAHSVDPDDFDLDAATEEPTRPVFNAVASDDGVPLLAGLTVDSVRDGVADVSWDAPDISLQQQLRIREVGGADWQVLTVAEGQTTYRISPLVDGQEYELQGRNRTPAQRSGNWSPDPALTFTAVTNIVPPTALAHAAAIGEAGQVALQWITGNDANQYAVQLRRGAEFAAATVIATVIFPANGSGTFTDVIAPGSYSYWLVPVNGSGVLGPESGPLSATAT